MEAIIRDLRTDDTPRRRERLFDPLPPKREWTPQMVLARLIWLPDDSACAASIAGGRAYRGWGQDRFLAKYLFDAVQANTIANIKIAAGKKHKSVKTAPPYPGPAEQAQQVAQSKPRTSVSGLATNFQGGGD